MRLVTIWQGRKLMQSSLGISSNSRASVNFFCFSVFVIASTGYGASTSKKKIKNMEIGLEWAFSSLRVALVWSFFLFSSIIRSLSFPAQSVICSVTSSHLFGRSFISSSVCPFIDLFVRPRIFGLSFLCPVTRSLVNFFFDPFIRSSFRPFIRLSIHPFIHSSNRSFFQ